MFRGSSWLPHGVTVLGVALGSLTVWAAQPAEVLAADHIDFPDTVLAANDPVADITDLMAWTPQSGRLALAVDLHPGATPETQFSDALDYQFRLRRVEMVDGAAGIKVPVVGDEEHVIRCALEGAEMRCDTPAGPISTEIGQSSSNKDVSLFAGVRADPFYLDVIATRETIKSGFGPTPVLAMPAENPVNFSDHLNVLSIVIELDVDRVLGAGSPTFAVVVETARR